jgi:proteasome accessory factor B
MKSNSPLLRQWLLLQSLASTARRTTIKSLSADTGVSEKTIRRDLSILRRAGFPIAESVGEFGRKTYELASGKAPALDFTYDEALALLLCGRNLAVWKGTFFGQAASRAFAKIRASVGEKAVRYVDRMIPRIQSTERPGDYSGRTDLINQLLLAIEDNRATFITYHSARSTEPVTYDVHPYGIVDHRGALYLIGFSVQHGEVRHWKIDRMTEAEVTKVPFRRPPDFDLERHLAGSLGVFHGKSPTTVRVRFLHPVARYVREKRIHHSQRLTPTPDGGVLAEYTLTATEEMQSFVLGFGANAEVLAPEPLRIAVQQELAAALSAYDTSHSAMSVRASARKKAVRPSPRSKA